MLAHRAPSFALLLVLVTAPLAAQASLTGYGPVNGRYRVVSAGQSSQVMMGETQAFDSKSDQVFTLRITKGGDALSQVMTLDSVTASSTSPVPLPDMSSAIGLTFTGTMDVSGKVATSTVTDKMGAASTSPMATNMRSFLPRLKVGAKVASSWVDTATTVTKQNGADVTTTAVTTFTFVGDTTVSGTRSWKITSVSTGKISGAGNQQGADFTIGGTVNGSGTFILSMDGVLLGVALGSTVNMLVEVPMASMTIPITQKQTTTITKLP